MRLYFSTETATSKKMCVHTKQMRNRGRSYEARKVRQPITMWCAYNVYLMRREEINFLRSFFVAVQKSSVLRKKVSKREEEERQ